MIKVTQGHEDGIGIELFFKAIACIPQKKLTNIELYGAKKSISKVLNEIGIDFKIDKHIKFGTKSIHFKDITNFEKFESTGALSLAMDEISSNDILLTLPTSKDQLTYNDKAVAGHTEYFRKRLKNENICMLFQRKNDYVLLLTDHIPLKEVPKILSVDFIKNKISLFLHHSEQIDFKPTSIKISGINPHSGEDGVLGNEDKNISDAIKKLDSLFKDINFSGPFSGDTIHLNTEEKCLIAYAYHDQGLASFKTKHGLYGLNLTIGMPFLRISPDFGTGFQLRNKNKAHYGSLIETIEKAINFHGD